MKFKIKSIQIKNLRKNQVIEWQGTAHRVREVTTEPGGLTAITLSRSNTDESEGVSFKASAFDAHQFTTRALAPTIRVDRLSPIKPPASAAKQPAAA